jgi:hypothetical protein
MELTHFIYILFFATEGMEDTGSAQWEWFIQHNSKRPKQGHWIEWKNGHL